ncbi:MAG: alpha-L-rhamnosidase N-terminal domain-containing protein, partial [Eubacteriales bacterium]
MNYLYALSTEKMRPAVGIDVQNPRLSWKIHAEETGILQISYRIQVLCSCGKTVWDSEVVPSSAMTVRYAGETLRPAADYQWNVTVLLSNGETLTADGVPFTTGLLDSNLFEQAKWISFPHTEGFTKEMLPAFRREFSLTKPLSSAKLFITGCGIYAAYLNGERVSNLDERGQKHVNELTPGFTEASKRKLYHSYDVTHLLNAGANCLSAIVTTGWWSDSIVRSVGGFSALRALLLLNYTDGTCGTLATDESWKVSDEHPVKEASVYHGETYDARVPMDFVKPGF